MEAFWAAISSSFSTWVKVAVCAMNSLLLAGFDGSWYFIWATRSFRNMSFWLPWSLRVTVVAAEFVATFVALTASGIGRSAPSQTSTSTPDDVERLGFVDGPLPPISAGRPQG